MSEGTSLLVLGLGNVLLEDDGVGAIAVQRLLEEYEVPESVRVLDGGTLGLSLLHYVTDAERLILVDAVRANGAAGSLVRLDGDDVAPAVATRLSPHQVGVSDLLESARWLDRLPSEVVLLGVVPQSIELNFGLTPPVQDALSGLVDRVVAEAHDLGFEFRKRSDRPIEGHL
ncbi:MAG TPA: HyaD/HybD family hydrogenase maturation endopeptidase [Vicinamibacterales bacterium]|nr:HyaD/HybD family hydrogenase maturation endopeptidase [Vicinamibacterales bacterium]